MTDFTYDLVVIGGGPAGATAAHDAVRAGRSVLLLDRAGRVKPCGGAIPPRALRDFAIPDSMLVARATCARMVSPSDAHVDIAIEGGFVGMVDRAQFDEWLRVRAAESGAERRTGHFERLERDADGVRRVHFHTGHGDTPPRADSVRARCVVGADGARSAVARQAIPGAERGRFVFAYHEVVQAPAADAPLNPHYDPSRCDIYYRGNLSPDFYSWVFPHGDTLSIGTGSADKGCSMRGAITRLRAASGLAEATTLRREGAPLPLKPLPRWDDGRDVVLAGDAAGLVAPAGVSAFSDSAMSVAVETPTFSFSNSP
ncbi:MAG: geranylgeranyl reductase family protein [Leptothrix sp. (in: b-proteobacteria)]